MSDEYGEAVNENGVMYRVPILTDEEREERHQNFLKVADGILEKYKHLLDKGGKDEN